MTRRTLVWSVLATLALPAWSAELAEIQVSRPDGTPVPLSGIAPGRPVAVIVMKGSWCPACVGQLRSLDRRAADVAATGGIVVGLAPEPPGSAATLGLDLPVYADPTGEALIALGFLRPGSAVPMPGVLFLDRCGQPGARLMGRRPGLSQDEAVLRTLRELAAEESPCAPSQV